MAPASRRWRVFAIVVVVLAILLVAADRIGNYVAERTAADTIQSSQNLSSRPDVDIGGFPFLTQLAAGEFDRITVTAKDVPVGQSVHLLDVSRVQVVLHKVTVSRDFSSVRAATATATARITYADLGRTLGLNVSYAGNGRITAKKSVTIAGRTIAASVTTAPQLANGALSFAATQINGAGQLGGSVATALNRVFDLTVPLRGIPFKIQVRSLRVDRLGLTLDLAGSDLTYSN